jgi:dUTPase
LVICPVSMEEPQDVLELDSTERGEGGFGSSGR